MVTQSQLRVRDLKQNKHQLLHRITSVWTFTNLQYEAASILFMKLCEKIHSTSWVYLAKKIDYAEIYDSTAEKQPKKNCTCSQKLIYHLTFLRTPV